VAFVVSDPNRVQLGECEKYVAQLTFQPPGREDLNLRPPGPELQEQKL